MNLPRAFTVFPFSSSKFLLNRRRRRCVSLCLFAAIFLSLWKWIGSDTDSQSQLFSRITSYRMWNEIQISCCFCERRVRWCTYNDLFGGTKGSTESDSAIADGWHCLCMPSANVKTINFGFESEFSIFHWHLMLLSCGVYVRTSCGSGFVSKQSWFNLVFLLFVCQPSSSCVWSMTSLRWRQKYIFHIVITQKGFAYARRT